ncbi:MAG: DUF1836 domain-containing protein [Heyndrickxia sp.]
MDTFHLTRKEMAELLLSLKGWNEKKPLKILQEGWLRSTKNSTNDGNTVNTLVSTYLPPIFDKISKETQVDIGLSLNEIVALGNQIENTSFSTTAVQNWVKRDIKEMIVSPQKGKKYSLEQTALLFLVEDLKSSLDFESIRRLLKLIINDPEDNEDDLINPIHLYTTYSILFDELNRSGIHFREEELNIHTVTTMEKIIEGKAKIIVDGYSDISKQQREAIKNIIVIATLSVYTAYYQMLAKRYLKAALFAQNIEEYYQE